MTPEDDEHLIKQLEEFGYGVRGLGRDKPEDMLSQYVAYDSGVSPDILLRRARGANAIQHMATKFGFDKDGDH